MVRYEIRFEEMMFQFRHWAQDGGQKRGYDLAASAALAAERDATYSVAASEAKPCTLSALMSLSFQLAVAYFQKRSWQEGDITYHNTTCMTHHGSGRKHFLRDIDIKSIDLRTRLDTDAG